MEALSDYHLVAGYTLLGTLMLNYTVKLITTAHHLLTEVEVEE